MPPKTIRRIALFFSDKAHKNAPYKESNFTVTQKNNCCIFSSTDSLTKSFRYCRLKLSILAAEFVTKKVAKLSSVV